MRGLFLPSQNQDGERRAFSFAKAARLAGLAKGDPEAAERLGAQMNLADRVVFVAKAAIGAGTTGSGDYTGASGAADVTSEFYAAMQDTSLLFNLLETGAMIRLPYRSRLAWQIAEATAAIRGEGNAARLSNAQMDVINGIEPTDAAAIIVVADELLKTGGTGFEAFLDRALRRATSKAADTEFLDLIIDGDTPVIASEAFTDADDVILDIRSLIEAVEPTEDSRLVFGMHPDIVRAAALLQGTGGDLFPNLTITGGNIKGIPVVPVAALAAGEIVLVDGSGVGGDAGLAQVKSTQGDVQMSDAPTNNSLTSTGSTLVSLWQNNLVGIMSRVEFGVERLRDTAVAKMTGVAWGGGVNES